MCERWIVRRNPHLPAAVRCAWQRLVASHGRRSIASIVQEAGCSQRHFSAQFEHEIGLSPKVFARILRFRGVVRAIRAGQADLADLACAAGYYDQSHLYRDAREFAGTSPRELLRSLLPDRGGFAVEIN